MVTLRAPDLAGTVLGGRYQLEALVGDGAFGRVYRGRDLRLARSVAVKVIKPWWAEDPEWVESFEREAQLLARVSDPGIVQIFDIGQSEEGLYYVAELVDGESLSSRLRRGPIRPRSACEIAEQLCRALAHAHSQRVVHRDIKPANVLISAQGRVKVGDFGVARLAEGTSERPGTVVGTPTYMAPEQARGLPPSPASDIYSVGVVLYEMLAGEPPFTGGPAVELALHHISDAPPPLPAGTPPALAKIVARGLAKNPAERFESAEAMADALAKAGRLAAGAATVQRPRPTRASAPDPTRVAPRFSPRRNISPAARRQTIAAGALALIVLAAMAIAAIVLAAPARVRVPELRGLDRHAATSKTRHLHLRPVFSSRYDAAPAGHAISQRPAAGASTGEGSTVRIVLSAGPPPVEVPRLVGQSSTGARSILDSLGLAANVSAVPAPGVRPGVVTDQSPRAGKYVRPRTSVSLTIAAAPRWRPVTSFSGQDAGSSVPFRIRGSQWRVVYSMSFVGTCSLIFFCDGPNAQVVQTSSGAKASEFGMNDGSGETHVIESGPGVYQVKVTPGGDTARWSFQVQDHY